MRPHTLTLLVVVAAALAGCAVPLRRPPVPLHRAAASGDLQALKDALDRGEDPRAPEPAPSSASPPGWEEERKTWELPFVYRMPPTERVDLKRTPLHFAAAAGRLESLELLLQRGAALEARDARGRTALHYAAGFDRGAAVSLLLSRGAGCSTMDAEGWSPLHVASSQGALQGVTALLDRCAAVNERTRYYEDTPLHLAAFGGHREVVELLLARGADAAARSKLGWTPADLAAGKGYQDLAKLLESRGGRGDGPPASHHLGLP